MKNTVEVVAKKTWKDYFCMFTGEKCIWNCPLMNNDCECKFVKVVDILLKDDRLEKIVDEMADPSSPYDLTGYEEC